MTQQLNPTQQPGMVIADESPAMAARRTGPSSEPTHPLAGKAAVAPGRDVDSFVRVFLEDLNFHQGVTLQRSTLNDQYLALARTVRSYMMKDWLETARRRRENPSKMVGYLSAEYLLGRQMGNALLNSGLDQLAAEAMNQLGIDVAEMRAQEIEPGLGNGGLGRLAACFIDSLATLDVSCVGYGIRYEYGIFKQTFRPDGRQAEVPDSWLALGDPWEFPQPDRAVTVGFGGHTEPWTDSEGRQRYRWVPAWNVQGVPYQYMVPGYRNGVVNTLRLWSARATNAFDLEIFNAGDYEEAVRAQTFAENITKVLYPEDSTPQGRELRLQQQYFFVACSLHDYLNQTLPSGFDLRQLPEQIIFQLNDTHPVIAVPELMRQLMDDKGFGWDEAWDITRRCFAYTCHTLLPEALEQWPVELIGRLLPRHLEIIYGINETFLGEIRESFPGDDAKLRRMSIIGEGSTRTVRMAHLASVAATRINGVAELHSQLLRDDVLNDFEDMWPDKFTSVTNGVTPRRFVRYANPWLSDLITEAIGDGWVTDLDKLAELEPLADDAEFRKQFRAAKQANKDRLRDLLLVRDGIDLPEHHVVDVMVKRLHEYKRQTLKLLHIITMYDQIISGQAPESSIPPRTFVFGAKAAPGYHMAKDIIALINAVARTIDHDPRVAGRMKVVFPANYNVTLAEKLIPAADISEQISLAGLEASGTGNMKFMMNGALTVGTDDGANVEIRKLVGDEHFFLFGMNEPEASALRERGYNPAEYYESDPQLKRVIDLIASGTFTDGDAGRARSVADNLRTSDRFMALADYRAYIDVQEKVAERYHDWESWSRSAVINVARSGFFSSDRSMHDYMERIWKI